MNGTRKVFGFLILMAFAAFALPAAAQKVYTLNLSTSSLAAGSAALPLTATMNNISPDQGNSTIKSFKLWAPAGITIKTPATSLVVPVNIGNGYTALIQNNGTSIYLSSINLPLKPFAAQPLVLSMTVATACTGGGAWTTFQSGKFQVWNGSAFTGQNFDQQAPSNLTTAFTAGACNGVVYNGNGSTGGTVPTDSNLYGNGAQVTVLGNTGNLVKSLNYFTGWTDNSGGTGTVYVAGSQYTMGATATTFYAKWASKALSITSSPTSAAVGVPFDVVVGNVPGGAVVTVDPSSSTTCAGATISGPTTTGSPVTSTKFTVTVPSVPASGDCGLLFNAADYVSIPMPAIKVYKGVLDCNDYDSINGPSDAAYDPDLASSLSGQGSSYVGTPGWGLRRGPNKNGAACVKVNYSCDMTANATTNEVTCTWDKNVVPAQQATFKYLFLWAPRPPQANGWSDYRPLVSWPPAVPDNSHTFPNWAPLVSCVSDLFSTPPTLILPLIPNASPFNDSPANTLAQYQPYALAYVCGARQGWTAVGTAGTSPGNGVQMIQTWNVIIDEADLRVAGP